jgi:heme/copper-type cytochrome/quinol oxidase subunit 3
MDVFEGLDPAVRARTKTILMAFIVFAVVMLFAGFTSAWIVSNMGSYWVHVTPPQALWTSTVLIVLSSLTLWWATREMRNGRTAMSIAGLAATLVLGIGFTLTQSSGWRTLSASGMGWTVSTTESGLKAYRWNAIDRMLESPAVYGTDYEVRWGGRPLVYDAATGDFYAPDDSLKARPITREVLKTSNTGGAYIWALILVHIVHLVLGFIYLTINLIRAIRGSIHPGDTVRLNALGVYWHALGALWVYLFVFLFIAN